MHKAMSLHILFPEGLCQTLGQRTAILIIIFLLHKVPNAAAPSSLCGEPDKTAFAYNSALCTKLLLGTLIISSS